MNHPNRKTHFNSNGSYHAIDSDIFKLLGSYTPTSLKNILQYFQNLKITQPLIG